MKRRLILFFLFSALAAFTVSAADVLAIRGATLIDPAHADAGNPVTVIIQDGVIRAVGTAESTPVPAGARVIEADGQFVMPGIADMHNHLRTGTFRPGDDYTAVLRDLLSWGVTTTFDPGLSADVFSSLRAQIEAEPLLFPRTFLIRGVFTTAEGWGRGYTPATPDEARAIVRELKAAGSDGVKLMYDDMRWATTRPFPVMSQPVMAAVIDEAHRQGMKAYAHAPILELAREVLAGGVDCLIHGILDEPVDDEFIRLMRKNNACYISTLAMFQTNDGLKSWADRLDAHDDQDRLDASMLDLFRKAPSGTSRLDNTKWAAEHLPVLRANLLAVHQAGILIAMGTDTGIPGVLPGIAAQLEMVMHVEAGLTPAEVIEVATRNAAVMMDQPDRFGGVTEGMAADLLILDADPRQNIVNIREIRHVIRGGQLVQ